MRTLATVLLLAAACLFPADSGAGPAAPEQQPRYMAFCTDGDGDLTGWLNSRDEAYMAGRDHEKNTRGHRWEVLVESSGTRTAEHCSASSPGKREGIMKVENVCSECRIFRVARKMSDGSEKEKDITFQPNAARYFRLLDGSTLNIRREASCPQ